MNIYYKNNRIDLPLNSETDIDMLCDILRKCVTKGDQLVHIEELRASMRSAASSGDVESGDPLPDIPENPGTGGGSGSQTGLSIGYEGKTAVIEGLKNLDISFANKVAYIGG